MTAYQKMVSLLSEWNINMVHSQNKGKNLLQTYLFDGSPGPCFCFAQDDNSFLEIGMPISQWEKRLYIILDAIGAAEGFLFETHWDLTEQEKGEILAGYKEWEGAFHLIWHNRDEIGRCDLVKPDPGEWAKTLQPGQYVIQCTDSDFALKAGLCPKEGFTHVFFKN